MNYFLDILKQPIDPVMFPSNPNGLADVVPDVRNKRYYKFIKGVLDSNKDKNFVKRIFDPSMTLDLGDGETGTHMMAYDPKSKRAYPTIVEKDGKLVRLGDDEAYDYADQTKEFIEFKSAKDAKEFSENGYKIIWNNEHNPFIKKKSK
jgi:hypothetical protein